MGLAGRLGSAGYRWYPVTVLALSALILWGVGVWFARRGVLVAPVLRETGINLEATWPGERPTLWLCAHLDTKSQPVPTFRPFSSSRKYSPFPIRLTFRIRVVLTM